MISLCLGMFPWADYVSTKGGVKLYVLLYYDDYLSYFARIMEANEADAHVAHTLNLPKGSIMGMDRGYNDCNLFADWTEKGIFLVTRLKKNASYKSIFQEEDSAERGHPGRLEHRFHSQQVQGEP